MTIEITVIQEGPGDVDHIIFEESLYAQPVQLRGLNGGYPSMAEVVRVIARHGDPMDIFRDAQDRLRGAAEAELQKPGREAAKAIFHAARKRE